jgi:hypothetical protein
MYSQEEVISWDDYYGAARRTLMGECCVSDEAIEGMKAGGNGLTCLHLRTRDQENIVGSYPGYNRLYKHVFLQNPGFKKEVIDYYKTKGFNWVDIVPLNRIDWKIFLFYPDPVVSHQEFGGE